MKSFVDILLNVLDSMDIPEEHEIYTGNVTFEKNNWKVVVFYDCPSYDYVDSIETPDGMVIELFDDYLVQCIEFEILRSWKPHFK